MAAMPGRVGKFEPERKDWTSYVEILVFFSVDANDTMDEEKKQSVFLSVIGLRGYTCSSLRSLLVPDKPGEKIFKSLTEIMTKHYKPAASE